MEYECPPLLLVPGNTPCHLQVLLEVISSASSTRCCNTFEASLHLYLSKGINISSYIAQPTPMKDPNTPMGSVLTQKNEEHLIGK
ncbi:hypothetical protein E2C01_092912 [Portunus trituberculatus]|uniref:Uncharacterized protein n=1 Tax=Portunus trituberculatus TaxID=210409 RepID=A0A5B7JNF3_PORTR|nr:hypothetical protein [Portunus trituberculatus]